MSRRLVLVLERLGYRGEWQWFLRDARTSATIQGPICGSRRLALKSVAFDLDFWAREHGCLYELRVRRLDGTIGETRTYPRSSDPKRSKG